MGQDGHMTELSAKEVVAATAEPIHTIGTNIYLSPQTFARAAEWGWTNPFSFYFAGRGAPLGEVSPSLVAAAMGWFNPTVVTAMYQEGVGVAGVKAAADKMLEATALWGRDHYGDFDGVDRFVVLGDRLVDGAEGAGLPLFVGWRGQVRADDGPARAAQLFQILRESARCRAPGGDDRRRVDPPRGNPHQRGRRSGEILRMGGAVRRTPARKGPSTTRRRR